MLKSRQLDVLRLVIQTFTSTDQPVGSATLQKLGIDASSATIRNDLALLEDEGFLEKTHVSSGRIPSIKGYRYYVDHLLSIKPLERKEQDGIHRKFNDGFRVMNDLVAHSSKVLSQMTHYTSFVSELDHDDRVLTAFQLVALNDKQFLVIMVTNKGHVEHHVYPMIEGVTTSLLNKIDSFVNIELLTLTIRQIRQRLRTEFPMTLQRYFEQPKIVLQLMDMIFDQSFNKKFYMSGAMNLLTDQYMDDLETFKKVYDLISSPDKISAVIAPTQAQMDVRIGDELNNQLLKDMTLITTNYCVEGHGQGTIALLGPTNMNYEQTLQIVLGFKKELEAQMKDYYSMLNYSRL